MIKINNKVFWLLCISFIEGGLVMALELVVAKLVNPFFGGSVYVWAALLSVALSGLALGYFAGSYITKKNGNTVMLLVYTIVAAFMFLIPLVFFNGYILSFLGKLPLKTGVLLACVIFILPVLLCWGIVSPLLIKLIQQITNERVGKNSALIYTISTLGGVIFTLVFGFYFIPNWGLDFSLKLILSLVLLILILAFSFSFKFVIHYKSNTL